VVKVFVKRILRYLQRVLTNNKLNQTRGEFSKMSRWAFAKNTQRMHGMMHTTNNCNLIILLLLLTNMSTWKWSDIIIYYTHSTLVFKVMIRRRANNRWSHTHNTHSFIHNNIIYFHTFVFSSCQPHASDSVGNWSSLIHKLKTQVARKS